jgi:hypothetical protein
MAKNRWNDKAILKKIRRHYSDKMLLACEFLEGDMKARASGQYGDNLRAVDEGEYIGSFNHEVKTKGTEIIGSVANSSGHGPYIEFGTGELAENGLGRKGGWFFRDKKGKLRFTLGMKPRPIMRSALIESKRFLQQIFDVR